MATFTIRVYGLLLEQGHVLVSDELIKGRPITKFPGGGLEYGEGLKDCLVREVREEVALEVKNLQYVGSQCWPFPHSMMLGFHAEYAGGEIVMQADEIEDAQWFSVHALPPLPAGRSIARYLIDLYVARRLGLAEPVLPR